LKWSLLCYVLIFCSTGVYSEIIKLHVPILIDAPKQHLFFHELLSTAIKQAGHTPQLKGSKVPQLRIRKMLDSGHISLYWMIKTVKRDQKYIPIDVNLTGGLIGNRVLLIQKGQQTLYNSVNTIEDFRKLALVAGMGSGWFDVKVWQSNNLPYIEHQGNWHFIFKMITKGRAYNYISRGINEIIVDSKSHPELAIEEKLLFIYNNDFRFYLSNKGVNAGNKYQDIITSAMKQAEKTGLIKRLVNKYWAKDLEALNYEKRIQINLSLPNTP